MKKLCIVACSLLVAASLALGVVSSGIENVPQEAALCDMDYEYVSI